MCVGPVRWTRDEIQIQESQLVGADLHLINRIKMKGGGSKGPFLF